MAEFAGAFGDADTVEVLDIYAASEEPIAGVDAQALVKAIGAHGKARVEYAGVDGGGGRGSGRRVRGGDVILTLGAGSVSQAGALLLEA